MVAVRHAQEAREAAKAVVVKVRPSAPGDAYAVKPAGFDRRPIVDAAGGGERALVEEGVGDGDASCQVPTMTS